jgi:hypothetical protein
VTTVLALPLLFEAVSARMTADAIAQGAIPTAQLFGWREPEHRQQTPSGTWRRVVWVPGDDGDIGELGPARQPGRNPKPLATLAELFTVYLEAADLSGGSPAAKSATAENELAQYTATRLLFDAWYRAAFLHAGNQLGLESMTWHGDKKVRRFGACIRVVCSIPAMIPDAPLTEIGGQSDTPARAAGVTELLDVEESDQTGPAFPAARAVATTPLTLSGPHIVDGVVLAAADRVLLVAQADPAENGLYIVAVGAWARTDDVLEHRTHVHVQPGGTAFGNSGWSLTTPDPITVGVSPLTFVRVSPSEVP